MSDHNDRTRATTKNEIFEWGEVRRGVFDFQTWVTGSAFFANIVAIYSYTLFFLTIVAHSASKVSRRKSTQVRPGARTTESCLLKTRKLISAH
ncbi:hypothetical protein AN958_01071 [Leucoagaricus sp. SymC.cos]|nr:hypothetical protein AN958_01071 [Leucoagaricus sp. SymC.cos]